MGIWLSLLAKLYHKQMGGNFVKIYFHCTVITSRKSNRFKFVNGLLIYLSIFQNEYVIGILSILSSAEMMPSLTTDRALL